MTTPTTSDAPRTWRWLAAGVAITFAVWAVGLSVLAGEIIPPVIIFAAIVVVFWGLTVWRPNKITWTLFGVLGVAIIALNFPFIIEDLSHPESPLGFNTTVLPLLGALLAIITSLGVLMRWSPTLATRSAIAAAGLFIVGIVVSVVATAAVEDDTAQPGDTEIVAKSVEWEPETVTAADGVFVDNQDPVRHTFAIESLDLEIEVPASTKRRIALDALPAGTYEFICSVPGHEDMTGTITIED